MRTKALTGYSLKPGMVIRGRGVDTYGLDLTAYREIATVDPVYGWPHNRWLTFTDGTRARISATREFQVARGKTTRNATKARAAFIPSLALANALGLLGGYATA